METFNETVNMGQAFEEKLAESPKEELDELKTWLFKENIRIEMARNELKCLEEEFLKERKKFQEEMKEIKGCLELERKRLKQDEVFFEKKMDILKNGFIQLDEERKKLEKEKINFEAHRDAHESFRKQEKSTDMARFLFQGVKSQLALKKRYKDLIKMFHPDNIAGDHEMVLIINSVYEELKKDYEMGMQA